MSGFARWRGFRPSFWLSCCYFGYIGAIGCFMPFITLYYRHLHLSGWEIGTLTAISPLGIAFVAPLWGSLADSFSAHRMLLRVALLVAAVTALLLSLANSFLVLLPLIIVLAASLAAIPSLLDGYAVVIAERERASYGRMRVWGSIGFIGSVWLVARLMGPDVSHFFLFAYAAMLFATCMFTLGLPELAARAKRSMWRGMTDMFANRSVVLLLIIAYLVTINAGIMGNYFSLYLSELGGDVGLIAAASVTAAVSELPMMVFGKWLLDRMDSRKVLLLSIVMYVIRLSLYSIPPALPLILLVQCLHGMSYGLYLISSITLIYELAGRDRAATAQSLLNSVSVGFGAITGTLVGGVLLDRVGALGVFRLSAMGMVVVLVVCTISVWQMRRVSRTAGA